MFLQPLLLAGLPLAALPIVIHLIHRQRHRTMRWGAMMFLLDAKRMTRGMAKLRHWLILAMRVLAILVLIVAIARPLASGWLGLTVGGQPDTTLVLLDRSASMEQMNLATGASKRSTALAKVADYLTTVGDATSIQLIENTRSTPQPIDTAAALLDWNDTQPTATSADIPGLLQAALDTIVENESGRTDIWICSDLRATDWKPTDGRWAGIRSEFEKLEGVRFHLLTYRAAADDNLTVSVSNVQRRSVGTGYELVLDIHLRRSGTAETPLEVPLEFVLGGGRTVLRVTMPENELVLQGHTLPLDSNDTSGWGRVELPSDSNPMDNLAYFVYADPPERHTVIVSDDPQVSEPIELAATAAAYPYANYSATVIPRAAADGIDYSGATLIVWQAPLPGGLIAQQLQGFVDSGRPVIFFPADPPTGDTLFGLTWGAWQQGEGDTPWPVTWWRGDSGLLAHAQSGMPIDVGKLRVYRYCTIEGGGYPLARLDGGDPLIVRSTAVDGHAYFCTTLPQAAYSSLAQDGVAFYVMLHRCLDLGAASLGKARHYTAGSLAANEVKDWEPLDDRLKNIVSLDRPNRAGAFRRGEQLVAVNRPPLEDAPQTLTAEDLAQLFGQLNYRLMEDQVENQSGLASEIWKLFLVAMALALVAEAWLCLPEPKAPAVAT